MKYLPIPLLLLLGWSTSVVQDNLLLHLWRYYEAHKEPPVQPVERIYKEIDTTTLKLTFYYPRSYKPGDSYPAMIFFFGGGWNGGSIDQFRPHAAYFAARGLVCVLADYRVKTRHGTTPFEAVRDAKSAVRYLRQHHRELGIDPDRIIGAGGSAGGHLAAAAGNVEGLEEPGEDHSISSKPNALVLFNPVYDNGPDGYGYERIGERYPEISPMHNIRKGAPPTITFLGTDDQLIPVETAREYCRRMEAAGSRCDLFLYDGQQHGFFNKRNEEYYRKTVYHADQFLAVLGYIKGEPTIETDMPDMLYRDADRKGRPYAKDPSVVKFKGKYWMYYSLPPYEPEIRATPDGWNIGIAKSDDLTHWQKVGELLPGGDYERKGLAAPGARVLDGKVHLFYQTYGNGPKDAICHAWSEDGIHFTRNPTNPIFAPTGDWTIGRAIDAEIFPANDTLFLYWATRDTAYRQQMLGVAVAPLHSSYNRDQWTQLSDAPLLAPELPWEMNCIEAASIFAHNGKRYMFYAGAYNHEGQQIGLAESYDGIQWKRVSEEPVLPKGKAGTWNATESGHPGVFVDEDGTTWLFFQGHADKGFTYYLSRVKVRWTDGRIRLE